MKKQFFLNILINLGLVFLVVSGVSAYQVGHTLILGLSIALVVVLIYLKVVLLKHVNASYKNKQEDKSAEKRKKHHIR